MVARSNERYQKERGAIEAGQEHYPLIVLLHVLFLCSLLLEYIWFKPTLSLLWPSLLIAFLTLQFARVWAIQSLGRFWNTKIIILPGAKLVKRGPYKWMPHPNYAIVALEIAVIPLIFQAYYTAILFTLLNYGMMLIRIPIEEKALEQYGEYTHLENDKISSQ
ncbi:hypothetical protein JFL43_14655 [Viridibacillus sp. YIM B01967]|uniref:Isoprenylcysteine carboxyl methyltransferase n=2 Tax=Viridibacillus soli TaxID=2798301 RepID=A0ABS1H9I9_9BACL|nr:hypothetical protein [Viridibacillus soli]